MNISNNQVNALKHLILCIETTIEAKKLLFALINASKNFTVQVAYTTCDESLINEVSNVLDSNMSPLWPIMSVLGAKYNPNPECPPSYPGEVWDFAQHDGYFSEGKFIPGKSKPGNKNKETRTFWLSYRRYYDKATEIYEDDVKNTELSKKSFMELDYSETPGSGGIAFAVEHP